jgi:hypothetical protein
LFALLSKHPSGSFVIVVLEGLDECTVACMKKLTNWFYKNHGNAKLQTKSNPIMHNTLVVTCSNGYHKEIATLNANEIITLTYPTLSQKVDVARIYLPNVSILELEHVVSSAMTYHDTIALCQEVKLSMNFMPILTNDQLSTMSLDFRRRYKKSRDQQGQQLQTFVSKKRTFYKSDFTNTQPIYLNAALKLLCSHADFHNLTKRWEFDQLFPITFPRVDLDVLMGQFQATLFLHPEESCQSLDTFSDLDLFADNVEEEMKETFWEMAVLQSPPFHSDAKEEPPINFYSRETEFFLQGLQYAIGASNSLDALERLHVIQHIMPRQSIFPVGFLGWEQDHVEKHDLRAYCMQIFFASDMDNAIQKVMRTKEKKTSSQKRTCDRTQARLRKKARLE